MTIEPEFYTMAQTQTILALSYQTVRALIRDNILVQSGRGKGCLISRQSVDALVRHMQQGGDKWDAPKMATARLVAAPEVTRNSKRESGSRTSPKTESSTATAALTKRPPKPNARSLRLLKTNE